DRVDADAGERDDLQLLSRLDHLGGDARAALAIDRVGVDRGGGQLVLAALDLDDLRANRRQRFHLERMVGARDAGARAGGCHDLVFRHVQSPPVLCGYSSVLSARSKTGEAMPAAQNVLLIVVDQWRGLMLPRLGADYLKLPNIEALSAEGVTFSNHFTQCVPCGPARASLLTSQYLMNHRAVQNTIPLS